MLKSFLSRPNLFRLLVVLIFAGGLVFAATYDGFSPKTQAESCCSGTDTEPIARTEPSGCCGGTTGAACSDGTVDQPEISLANIEEISKPIPSQNNNCCNRRNCPGINNGCGNGCTSVPKCIDSCQCSYCGTGPVCSSYGSCGKNANANSSSSCTSS